MFETFGVGKDPGHEIDDLAAVKVDHAERGTGGNFEGVAVATRDDVGFCIGGDGIC